MKCGNCGRELADNVDFCYTCGSEIASGEVVSAPADLLEPTVSTPPSAGGGSLFYNLSAHNTSLPGERGNDPGELHLVKGWNWGAFVFSWIWAFVNGLTKQGLISFLLSFFTPGGIGNFFYAVYLGINGNEILWKEGKKQTARTFRETQRKWAIGAAVWLFFVVSMIFIFMFISLLSK